MRLDFTFTIISLILFSFGFGDQVLLFAFFFFCQSEQILHFVGKIPAQGDTRKLS